jgi:hypothetical protein
MMKLKRVAIFFVMLFIGFVLAIPVEGQSDFVIVDADDIAVYGTKDSAKLTSLISNIDPRFIFQYANQLHFYTLSDVPTDLGILLQYVEDRFIFQYLNWMKVYSLTPPIDLIGDDLPPVIYAISYSVIDEDSVEITWLTDEYANADVWYGTISGELTDHVVDFGWYTGHEIELSGLSQCTQYYFRIFSTDRSGNTAQSDELNLFTYCSPDAFSKLSPKDGAVKQKIRLPLEWDEFSGADSYQYCLDTIDDDACTTPARWVDVGNATTVTVKKLKADTTYFWQVRAVTNSGYVEANDGVWWSFTTRARGSTTPKLSPDNGAINQPTSLLLEWDAEKETSSFEYCIDLTDDGICTANWFSVGLDTSVYLTDLAPNTTYFWQVRGVIGSDYSYADDSESDFWYFTTGEATSSLP